MREAVLEPFAKEMLQQLRMLGYATAVWTNDDSMVTEFVLGRFQLQSLFDLVITRDQVKRLKLHGDGHQLVKIAGQDCRG